jgi:hypothetical protein
MSLGAVMLNWKRQENVEQIVDSWDNCPLFDQRIVWTNRRRVPSMPGSTVSIHSSEDLGLYTRFHAGILTRCDAVFMQDDDLLIPHGTIVQLYNRWRGEPDRIHGLFGRAPKKDNTYAVSHDHDNRDCDIVLTRTLIVSTELLCRFMYDVRQFLSMQCGPYGNAEDIILSHVAKRYSGKPNRVWDLPRQELHQMGTAIHLEDRVAHAKHRTRVMHACQNWLVNEGV